MHIERRIPPHFYTLLEFFEWLAPAFLPLARTHHEAEVFGDVADREVLPAGGMTLEAVTVGVNTFIVERYKDGFLHVNFEACESSPSLTLTSQTYQWMTQ